MHGMLAKDYKERFTTAQIRKSIWFKRHRLALEEDFFEKVPAIQRERKHNSSSCYAALCRMHDVSRYVPALPGHGNLSTKNRLRGRFSGSKSRQATGKRFLGPNFRQESRTGF